MLSGSVTATLHQCCLVGSAVLPMKMVTGPWTGAVLGNSTASLCLCCTLLFGNGSLFFFFSFLFHYFITSLLHYFLIYFSFSKTELILLYNPFVMSLVALH
ncbi:hypothetical protein BDV23DRAFT_158408 [Aspergillus alliaceus]|uniref:Uncharacterized protein n=1 Tax=Petromyces alliaceus TaxID=209559 RepID=A0A5N6FJ36_PETAA|nr:uncharacterized protein BDW43DRAFT_287070 [Aspergillus alliaceus]KAB8229992.1 hypothetical protein BDW43DRAFT_287070 [Aspergillus alliaceus]KAE8388767.1 hypothetical protein BDV23DRAFT_158408 [Aspergillus alliaceus]